MRTLEDDTIIAKLRDFVKGEPSGISFALAMRLHGSIKIYERVEQPCYGEMREYKDTEDKPDDLSDPMPKGKPLAVAVRFDPYNTNPSQEATAAMLSFLCSPTLSPWRNVLGIGTEAFEALPNGFLILNTKTDADAIFHFAQFIRGMPNKSAFFSLLQTNPEIDHRLLFLASRCGDWVSGEFHGEEWNIGSPGYYLPTSDVRPKLVYDGSPVSHNESDTMFDRKFYHRQDMGDPCEAFDIWCRLPYPVMEQPKKGMHITAYAKQLEEWIK